MGGRLAPTPARDDNYRLHYQAHELLQGERLIDSWTAQRGSGLTSAGGQLVLTSQRLLYEPMRTPKNALLGPIAKLFGVGELGEVAKEGIDATHSLDQWSAPLGEIASVEPVDGERLHVALASGESWEFGLSAELYEFKGSQRNTEIRDAAIAAIRQAISGVPPDAPVTPAAQPAMDIAAVRQQAVSSGQPVVAYQEGEIQLYCAPDGSVRMAMGPRTAPPAGASPAPNLVGSWSSTDFPSGGVITLNADGSLAGQYALFGGLPPQQLIGIWWLEDSSTVSVRVDVHIAEFDGQDLPSYFEYGAAAQLIELSGNMAVVRASLNEEITQVTLQRVA